MPNPLDGFITSSAPRAVKYRDRRTGQIVTQFDIFDVGFMDRVNDDGSLYVQPKKKRINYKKMSFSEILQAKVDNYNNGWR